MTRHRLVAIAAVLGLGVAPLPGHGADVLLAGTRLAVKTRPTRPGAGALRLVSSDVRITLGGGNESADDPVRHGGSLRIVSTAGDRFDATYDLPLEKWRYLGDRGANRGYRLRRTAPVLAIVLKPGKLLKIAARGGLALTLAKNPDPVAIVLTLGGQRYCFGFRGTTRFAAGKRYVATDASAPPLCGPAATIPDPMLVPWPMHPIDSRLRGSNALSPADVDGDGLIDYVTNYEFDQRYVIELHPGVGGAVREPWPTIDAFTLPPQPIGMDSESATLADLDGDGRLDIAGAQGTHITGGFEGQSPGIHVIWGPPAPDLATPSAWIDAGRIPGTIDRGHFLWLEPFDVNGDGALDLVVGGRAQWDTGVNASIKWIEAPPLPADRRNLAQWVVHDIDPTGFDGHGFVLDDVDEDGDQDLVDANADFDTPEDQEVVQWFENPSTGSPAQAAPWARHEMYRGSEFYVKPQLAIADLDGDRFRDVITQVADAVYWFRKTSLAPVAFERIVVPKPALTQWRSRPIRVGDIDGDGKLDLFGMMTHDEGVIPGDKASAFWMSYSGPVPQADNWTTHLVKWGSGKPMAFPSFGEKWDQVQMTDVDGDGDLDAVANCEEWYEDDVLEFASYTDPRLDPNAVAVVWFENRLREAPYVCREQGGTCAIEAEHYTDLRDGTWIKRARYAGYAGDGYLQVHDPVEATPREWTDTRGLAYVVDVDGGSYHLWLRRWMPMRWGATLGGARSNAAWIGVNEEPLGIVDDVDGNPDGWAWVDAVGPVTLTAGRHLVTVKAREGGYAVDRIVLTTSATPPSGIGPVETL